MPDRQRTSITTLLADYAAGTLTVANRIDAALAALEATDRPEAWIHRVEPAELHARAAELDALRAAHGPAVVERMPLFGVPFAVKDNIDVAGLPTTAACPAFASTPAESAQVVALLLAAGAVLIGKTNLDQFATGLVGVRSPYGAVRQVDHPDYVSGGSSSGSAVAVAGGAVAFSLGTDTAGSGRVPAGFNGIVGLKPTLGLLSKRGVVPACRTLDTVSIFAPEVEDAWRVLGVLARFDAADPYSRAVPPLGLPNRAWRIGVPAQPEFFDDAQAEAAYMQTLRHLAADLLADPVAVDMAPLNAVARLLYDGPWVAERRAAIGGFLDTEREAMDPVVAAVVARADAFSAVDAFNAQYELAELRRAAEAIFAELDVLIVPSAPTHPTIAQVRADPIAVNSRLGYYTNFVNLLDLCALAIPALPRADGLPAGITLIGKAGADHQLATLGRALVARLAAQSGARTGVQTAAPSPSSAGASSAPSSTLSSTAGSAASSAALPGSQSGARPADTSAGQPSTSGPAAEPLPPLPANEPTLIVAVVGAHLRGQPLNGQLLEAGARFVEATVTSADYRLYALAGTTPPKPALVHSPGDADGRTIAIELWELPLRLFGGLVAQVPAPLGIGTVRVADGRAVKGFICEPAAVAAGRALDITAHGGWLAYLRERAAPTSAAISSLPLNA
ncbi:allophanate hydrolase [Burkholderia sp. Ap-962]|uniref:allophanate hydrolase n=1 Tax=Burkholderia sp. Ap-962 TaxID=2608333 RepID=UPI00141F62D8|nr:allophanate hydrolase [Burkholderia sp. Ap-962]NIF74302.1 allophanate hydrolase [Burkholderia sp. Ap-962]